MPQIEVTGPQTNQPAEETYRDILDTLNRDRNFVPDGYRAVPADEPTRPPQRRPDGGGGAGGSIEDLVKAELAGLIESMTLFKAETDKKQRGVEIVLTTIAGNIREMNAEHKKFNLRFQQMEVEIAKINGFIGSVRVDPPPPPPPIPQQQYVQLPQYAPPSAPPQYCWPYQQR
jgi:hypothetical protein